MAVHLLATSLFGGVPKKNCKLHTEGDFDFFHFSCNLDGCGCSGSFFLADRTIQESVAQGFEIVALGAFPASISSTGSQLVVRQRACARARARSPIFLVSIRKFRGWKFQLFWFKMEGLFRLSHITLFGELLS